MNTDKCGNTRRQEFRAKGRGKEVKIQEFRYRDTTNVGPEMYDYHHHHHKHQGFDPLIRSFSRAMAALANVF